MGCKSLKVVRSSRDVEEEAIKIALFRDDTGRICGCFIGPLQIEQGRYSMPFLPHSEKVLGSVAIVRAIEHAERLDLPLCLIDPQDLWESTWIGDAAPRPAD